MEIILLVFIFFYIIALLNGYIAVQKGRNNILWFVISIFIGPLASIFLIFFFKNYSSNNDLRTLYKSLKSRRNYYWSEWGYYNYVNNELNSITNLSLRDFIFLADFIEAESRQMNLFFSYFSIYTTIFISVMVGFTVARYQEFLDLIQNDGDIFSSSFIYYGLLLICVVVVLLAMNVIKFLDENKRIIILAAIRNYINIDKSNA